MDCLDTPYRSKLSSITQGERLMAVDDDKRFQLCQQQFQAIRNDHKADNEAMRSDHKDATGVLFKKLDGIDKMLRGNGQPGMMVRVDRLEQESITRSKIFWITAAAIIGLCSSGIYAIFLKG